jgi:hypothetical protein
MVEVKEGLQEVDILFLLGELQRKGLEQEITKELTHLSSEGGRSNA